MQYVVEEVVASGSHEILIVTAKRKRATEDHFDRNIELEQYLPQDVRRQPESGIEDILVSASIFYFRQTEHKGLGHAVSIAEKYVGAEPFSVLLADDLTFDVTPCQRRPVDAHARNDCSVIAVQRVPRMLIGRYGIVEGEYVKDGLIRIKRIVEKPRFDDASSDLATVWRYVLTPSIFCHTRAAKADTRGEIQLTDAIARML